MNPLFDALERTSVWGIAGLLVALGAQFLLDGRVFGARVPAAWRVVLWRAALLQCALLFGITLLQLAPLRIAVLPPLAPVTAPAKAEAPRPRAAQPLAMPSLPLAVRKSAPSQAPIAPAIPLAPQKTMPPAILAVDLAPVDARDYFSLRAVLLGFYALGLAYQLVELLRAWRGVRRVLRAGVAVEDAAISAQLAQISNRLHILRAPRLLSCDGGAPFLTGIFRPTIVVPAALLTPQNPALEAVLTHELAHLKRRDLFWNALLWPAQALLFFHPFVWIARRFLILETESACDEMVLAQSEIAPRFYGALLLNTMRTPQNSLTAGVSDGFFALQTRLQRLNHTPKPPRLGFKIAFVAAIVLGFGALMPLQLVARAQSVVAASEKPVSKALLPLGGKVVDKNSDPVAGATVYAMGINQNRKPPLDSTVSDANGGFQFSPAVRDSFGIDVFVDAGARGTGSGSILLFGGRKPPPATIRIAPKVKVTLRFVDPQGQPVPDLEVRLWRSGQGDNQYLHLPRAVAMRLQATTNRDGEAIFPALPAGKLAQFWLGDEVSKATKWGMGDRRGGRFGPLSTEDFVRLEAPETTQTIRLVSPIRIEGQVDLPGGEGAGNVLIFARRINAAEAAGNNAGRDFLIAQTRSNAAGKYVLDGLRPGRYYVWTYPEARLTRDYVGQSFEKTLTAKINTVDFQLSGGALVGGQVVAQITKQPVKGQTMGMIDSQGNYRYAITDARGFFRFRVLGGKQHLWVHANGSNSPPPGYLLPARATYDFSLKKGEKREFKIEMPVVKVITGTVVDADGQPVENAVINVEGLGGFRDYQGRKGAYSNARGRFSLPLDSARRPARLFARAGEQASLRGTVVRGGDDVTLKIEPKALSAIEGQIVDKETGKPLSDVRIALYKNTGSTRFGRDQTRTGADGRFRLAGLRPLQSFYLRTSRPNYGDDGTFPMVLLRNETRRLTISMHPLSATLRGRVLGENGKPAGGFRVSSNQVRGPLVGADGTFTLPRVPNEKLQVWITGSKNRDSWGPFEVLSASSNVTLRMTKALRQKPLPHFADFQLQLQRQRAALLGKTAPALQTPVWSQAPRTLAALRGQIVLLHFSNRFDRPSSLQDFARSFGSRGVQVIQIEDAGSFGATKTPSDDLKRFQLENDIPFPIALDAPLRTRERFEWSTGQSGQSYGGAQYAVIGQGGKIVYLGDDVSDAVGKALALIG